MSELMQLAEDGLEWGTIEAELEGGRGADLPWRSGRTTRTAFYVDEATLEVGKRAFASFICDNALYINQIPSLKRFEQEIIAMTAELLGGGAETAGIMTHGGTESIFMACLAAREWARQQGRLSATPRILVPFSAHPAFNKAGFYLGFEVVRAPLADSYRADVAAMAEAAAADPDNLFMMVGSAPCWPFGVIDPIGELAGLAAGRDLWFHVDACVGGFVNPFARDLGHPIPPFDLSVPGVCSLSADIHKYGFAPKGASVLLFRDGALRDCAQFRFDGWPTGLYATSGFLGTRNGGTIAGAWAVMRYLGKAGYRRQVARVMEAKAKLAAAIAETEGLAVLGAPDVTLIAYGGEELDVFAVAEGLEARDWVVSKGQRPPAIQMTLSPVHAGVMERYIADLRGAAADGRAGTVTARDEVVSYAS